jgi:CheY-like chemotaxis protein
MSSKASPASPGSPLRRILIVDGDDDTRKLYREILIERGWAVTEAVDGREALVRALSERLSIVVTELRLPFIDGVALCRILRRDRSTANVPILVVTSEVRDSHLKQAERAGANAVLIKPSATSVIVAEVDRLTQGTPSPTGSALADARRTSLVKAHERFETRTPTEPGLALVCPQCGEPLIYQRTLFGGVSGRRPERWDYFACRECGEFSYRHRTRKLRLLE